MDGSVSKPQKNKTVPRFMELVDGKLFLIFIILLHSNISAMRKHVNVCHGGPYRMKMASSCINYFPHSSAGTCFDSYLIRISGSIAF